MGAVLPIVGVNVVLEEANMKWEGVVFLWCCWGRVVGGGGFEDVRVDVAVTLIVDGGLTSDVINMFVW